MSTERINVKQLEQTIDTHLATRSSIINKMSDLLMKNLEGSDIYKAQQEALKEVDERISTTRNLLNHPTYQRMAAEQAAKDAEEARNNQTQEIVSAVKSATVITTPRSDERRARLETEMRNYLKTGNLHELRDVTVSTDNAALLPQEFALVADATKFYSTIVGDVYRYEAEGGRPVKFPISNDTANGLTVISEAGSTASVEADPTVSSTVLSTANAAVDNLLARLDYSRQFSDDIFSQSWIYKQLGVRAARGLAKAIMLGVDQNGTQLTASPTGGYLAGIPVGQTTSTLANGIQLTDLELLFASLDESYAAEGSFYMHQNTRSYLQSQKDSVGRSLYGASPQQGLAQLFNRLVKIDNNLPAPTLSAGVYTFTASTVPVVIFGNHALAYGAAISDTRIRVLKETHADIMVNEAICYVRLQAQKLIGGASAGLKLASS